MTHKAEFEIESELRELGFVMGPNVNGHNLCLRYTTVRDRITNHVKYFFFYDQLIPASRYMFRYNLFEGIEYKGLYVHTGPVEGFEKCITDDIAPALILYKDLLNGF